jgi:hypothetical protein
MTDKQDGIRGWWAIACATFALVLVTALSLCQTPTERAAGRLRVGMSQIEVANALSPEIDYRPLIVSWEGFTVEHRSGLRAIYTDGRLTGWAVGPPHNDW